MNKICRLLILSALLATGCRGGRGGTSQAISDTTVNPTSGQQSTTASSNASTQNTDTNTFTTSIAGISKEATVVTSGADFTERFHDGVQIVNNEGTFIESSDFITYFNSFASDPVLWKIAGINVMVNQDGEGGNHLKVGGKNSGQYGILRLQFNYQVTKIELEALPYYKYNSYGSTYNVDNETSISIDGEKTSLACTAGVVPAVTKVTKSYATPVNEISITTDECDGETPQRTFINSIKVTYTA